MLIWSRKSTVDWVKSTVCHSIFAASCHTVKGQKGELPAMGFRASVGANDHYKKLIWLQILD